MSFMKDVIPAPARRAARVVQNRILDIADSAKRRQEMIPPRTMNFVGNGDFKTVGDEFYQLFTQYGGMKPHDRVLDVGSGIGRMARPLTTYLTPPGEYYGFDIVLKGVEWCQQNISTRHSNFHFAQADILNQFYNPTGTYKASEYVFPFADQSFDFIFLTSVFTHMFPTDLENYLHEIARVLRKGQTCFITMFLMNEESVGLVQRGASSQNLIHKLDGCWTTSLESPESSLAFSEDYVRGIFRREGLTITEPIHFGSWCGRPKFLSYQDILIAKKN